MTRSERWILSEWQVFNDRRAKMGERLRSHRERTPFAEIDLLTETPAAGLVLLEVKSIGFEFWGERSLITRSQCLRLKRARTWLEARYQRPVSLQLAVVSHMDWLDPTIQYFEAGTDWLLT